MSELKPLYSVPTMTEVNALEWNGFNVVSTFSGGGGSCTGYRMAGYRVLYANEFIASARDTYKANHKDSYLDDRDIRSVSASEILEIIGLKSGDIDIFDGSPPCSAFSTAGKRENKYGIKRAYSDNANQVVDDLFFEYCRILKGLQPKVFVAENVSGLVKGTAKGYFKLILQALKDSGYNVRAQVLNAAWLGVPQSRERVIFIGVRSDLKILPVFPKPLAYCYTVADALKTCLSSPVEIAAASSEGYAVGEHLKKMRPGQTSEKYFQLSRAAWNKPSVTITATGSNVGAASVAHPVRCGKFTIPELRRICAFPDDYVLSGDYKQQYERMGRSVPPVMMRAISASIRDEILSKLND